MKQPNSASAATYLKPHFSRHLKCLATTVLGLGLLATAHAQQNIAVNSGDWDEASNWSLGVPQTSRQTVIRDGHTITVNTAGTSGTLYIAQYGAEPGMVGTLNVNSGGSVAVTGEGWIGTSTNATGTLNINGGSLSTSSHFNVATRGNAQQQGGYNATINVTDGGTLAVGAQLRLANDNLGGTATLTVKQGTITATNFYVGSTSANATFAVKGSANTISVGATFTVGSTSTIAFELDQLGTSAITANHISIAGGGEGGILDLSVLAGVDPLTLPETILLMSANNALSGQFATVNWGGLDSSKWSLQYDAKTLSLVHNIPEPTTVATVLAAIALGGVICIRRRKTA